YRVEDFETYFKTPGIWEEHLTHLRKHGVFVVESQNKNIVTGDLIDVEISVTYEDISNKGYLIAASRDVSERKKAEYEIQKLSLVAKNTNNGVLILDADRKITWANEAMVNRSKYSLEELIGNSPKMFQYEGTDQNAIQRIYQNLIELKPLHEELLYKSKSGDLYWIDLNIQPIFDQNNRHIGYIAIEFDITDRKKFEETIAEQNKSLKEITDALDQSSLVSIADLNGNITKVNEKFCQVAQFVESELIGKNHNIINSGYHSKEFWVELWKTIKSGEIWRGEVKNKAKDGSYYWVDSIIYPVFDLNGKIQHYLSIRHEITDKKEAEENLKIKSVFQNLLMDISSKYINLPIDQLEESIDESLSKLGTFVNVDRVYVFDYNYTNQTASNLFEWCADGIKPEIDNLQQIPLSDMPVWVKKHQAGLEVYVPNVSKLEPGKFRELLEIQEIKSIITIPMMENGKCIGFVGFDSVREVREFNEDEKNLLRLYSDMLVNVNSRTEYIRAI
ncbi:MAG: PAS domain S-box protein, partial [Crocinitomicaceae bacterium]